MDRTATELAQLRQAFTMALLTGSRHWRRAADAVVKDHGLSDATALPLVLMGRLHEEPRQAELADIMGVEAPSLVRLLDHLCAAGLVARQTDRNDRRAKMLRLTPAGRQTVETIEAELIRLREAVFAGVSAADLEAGLRVFTVLRDYAAGAGRDPLAGPNAGAALETVPS